MNSASLWKGRRLWEILFNTDWLREFDQIMEWISLINKKSSNAYALPLILYSGPT